MKYFFRSAFFSKKNQILPNDARGCRRHPRSAAGATRGPPQALGFWRCVETFIGLSTAVDRFREFGDMANDRPVCLLPDAYTFSRKFLAAHYMSFGIVVSRAAIKIQFSAASENASSSHFPGFSFVSSDVAVARHARAHFAVVAHSDRRQRREKFPVFRSRRCHAPRRRSRNCLHCLILRPPDRYEKRGSAMASLSHTKYSSEICSRAHVHSSKSEENDALFLPCQTCRASERAQRML